MKLHLRSQGIALTQELRDHVEERLHYALGRFRDRVRDVRVLLSDENGPRGGGDDIRCRIRVALHPRGELMIQETNGSPFAAVARASKRFGQRLGRHLGRLRRPPSRRR